MTARILRSKYRLLIGIVAAVVLGVGIGSAAAASGPTRRGQDAASKYNVNTNGMTYGSGLDATSPNNEPDLIEAIGVNGKVGYVRSADLKPPAFSNPAAALAHQRAGVGARTIPLYAVDGKTVIGQFRLVAPEPGQLRQ